MERRCSSVKAEVAGDGRDGVAGVGGRDAEVD